MYKDKDKQREAVRIAKQRQRRKEREGMTSEGMTGQGMTEYPRVSDQDFTRLMATAGPGNVRVSKPGDADYEPQCETTKSFVEDRPKAEPKHGLDIKCFEDLPPDVQQTIDVMSVVEGVVDKTIKANRTAIAIHYQHLFPDST